MSRLVLVVQLVFAKYGAAPQREHETGAVTAVINDLNRGFARWRTDLQPERTVGPRIHLPSLTADHHPRLCPGRYEVNSAAHRVDMPVCCVDGGAFAASDHHKFQ